MEKLIFDAPAYIDYTWLMYVLGGYASPRAKVTTLLRNGDLIRIKKGLYIAGPAYRKDWSRGVLANRIYGPSYVSYEYALNWYGLIPEHVENPTSATLKKSKRFSTPAGMFIYDRIPAAVFHHGLDITHDAGADFLIATPEKALADTVARNRDVNSAADVDAFLTASLRIDRSDLRRLDRKRMKIIAAAYANKRVALLGEFLDLPRSG